MLCNLYGLKVIILQYISLLLIYNLLPNYVVVINDKLCGKESNEYNRWFCIFLLMFLMKIL